MPCGHTHILRPPFPHQNDRFTALFSEGKEHHTLEDYPGVEFMTRDATHLMHEMLSIEDNYGYSQQVRIRKYPAGALSTTAHVS